MKIVDINLDDFDKREYLAFIQSLIYYYYVLFDEILYLKNEVERNE